MARGEADAQAGGAAGDGRKEDSGHIEAAIEKQLGRKDRLVCDAEGDQPNGQPASLLGRVDAMVKGVDAVLQGGLEPRQLRRPVDGGGGQRRADRGQVGGCRRSEEHTSELQSLMRTSYAVFCLKKKSTHEKISSKHGN